MKDQLMKTIEQMNRYLDHPEREEGGEDDARALFTHIFVLHDYRRQGPRPIATYDCGSIGTDTPRALYRLLFLVQPPHVDFSSMYKSEALFALCSPDYHFVAHPQFFKYKLAMYFSASAEHVEGRKKAIQSGMPGYDNGMRAKTPELRAWCALLQRCLERTWAVYPGNNFEV